jgi:type II secretory pathway component GspD/PulD (secretin)
MAFDSNAQDFLNKKVNLNFKEAKIKSVLSEIEKQVDATFIYSSRIIKADRKIDIEFNGRTLGTFYQTFSLSMKLVLLLAKTK